MDWNGFRPKAGIEGGRYGGPHNGKSKPPGRGNGGRIRAGSLGGSRGGDGGTSGGASPCELITEVGETAKARRKHLLSEVVAASGTVHSATAAGPQDKFSSCQLTCWGHAVWSAFCHSCQAISEPNFMLNCSVSDHATHVPGERGCCLPISISLSLPLIPSALWNNNLCVYKYICNVQYMCLLCKYVCIYH